MTSYGLLDAVLDLFDLGGAVAIVLLLICCLRALLKKQMNSCRECQPPDVRALLLWIAFTIPLAWVAAAASYFRNLSLLWNLMGRLLEDQTVNKSLYALLHFYLLFLILCGIYAFSITIFEVSRNRRVFNDLWMIARFRAERYQAVEDVEAQPRLSSSDTITPEAETLSAVGNIPSTSSTPSNETLHNTGQESNGDPAPTEESEHSVQNAALSIVNQTEDEPSLDDENVALTKTSSSSSSSSASTSGADEVEYVDSDDDQPLPPK